ncbi:YciI family protein [Mesorhizobium sp. LHD-90]|uniref:YciI family protein n=1 Tax=Mesorhizobium sp. LHD-90 TaxID=3071414 RepID=UPI0027E03660|nr:YciI family protein [Mesorhizobium sp. LHD-90]MDQ6433684.1 YciI family protein [Mesorhizobium sp. LHD-90]
MLYAMLAYHVEDTITAMTQDEASALMTDLLTVHARYVEEGTFGPAARLGSTKDAFTLRGPGAGMVIDGPFAETKEQLLGLYMVEAEDRDAAVEIARSLRRVNRTAVYEIRPVRLFLPGAPFPETAAE